MKRGNGPLRTVARGPSGKSSCRPDKGASGGEQGGARAPEEALPRLGSSWGPHPGPLPERNLGREGEAGSKDKREGWARARYPPVPPRLGSGLQARGARAAAPSRWPAPAGRRSARTRAPAAAVAAAAACASLAEIAVAASRAPARGQPRALSRSLASAALTRPRASPFLRHRLRSRLSPAPRRGRERSAPQAAAASHGRRIRPSLSPVSASDSLPFSPAVRPSPSGPSRRAARDARDPPARPYKARNRKQPPGGHGHRAVVRLREAASPRGRARQEHRGMSGTSSSRRTRHPFPSASLATGACSPRRLPRELNLEPIAQDSTCLQQSEAALRTPEPLPSTYSGSRVV